MKNVVEEWESMDEIPSENDPDTEGGIEGVDWDYVGVADPYSSAWVGKKRRKKTGGA